MPHSAAVAPGEDPRPASWKLEDAQARFAGRVIALTTPVVRRWGALAGRIRRDTGQAPPVIGALLAATAIEARLYLVTRNARDVRHTGAAVFNPWEDDPAAFPLSS